jgi:hypothetical protein
VLDVPEATLAPAGTPGEAWGGPGGLVAVSDDRIVWSADGGATWEPVFSS